MPPRGGSSLLLNFTLNYQALAFYERTLRLPANNFLQWLASCSVLPRLKRPSWRSFSPSTSPWRPSNVTVTTFIEGCSRFDAGQSDAAADFLRRLPTSDVVGTDGSVLGVRSAGVQATYKRCSSSSLLSYSAGPIFSSFSTESLALVHGLEWCHSHLKSCHFQSALFLTDF